MTANERKDNPGDPAREAELVEASRRGDTAAYGELVALYKEQATRVAWGIVRNPDDAADVAQDAFIKAYRSLARFKGDSAFFTWLYRIVVNLALDAKRKQARRGEVDTEQELGADEEAMEPLATVTDANPARVLEDQEMETLVNAEIEKLPEHHRTVILLREVEGLSYQEIADTMDCSIGTVMSRLHYARDKLQKALAPYLSGDQ